MILDKILCASEYHVEAGGLRWGLRRLPAAALLEAGYPALILAPVQAGSAPSTPPSLGAMLGSVRANAASVCAAVYEVADPARPDLPAEPITLVPAREQEDRAASRIWIESLPASVRTALIRAVAGQDGEAAKGIAASFPAGSAPAADPGPDSAPVRDDP